MLSSRRGRPPACLRATATQGAIREELLTDASGDDDGNVTEAKLHDDEEADINADGGNEAID